MVRKIASWILILTFVISISSRAKAQEKTDLIIAWPINIDNNISRFAIYRSSTPDTNNFVEIEIVDASINSYIDTGLDKGVRYFYSVKAISNEGIRSRFSNIVSGMVIPQDANPSLDNLCRITSIDITNNGLYNINWSTEAVTRGFIQFGSIDTLDSASDWDNDYANTHTNSLSGLIMPKEYLLRAVSYDADNNMTISMIDSLSGTSEVPISPSSPLLSIFPVPYHPAMGDLSLVNLPEDGSVAIFNENGQEIWQRNVGSETVMTWNGCNFKGSPVMSGVYYVLTRDNSGKVVNKRPIIIIN